MSTYTPGRLRWWSQIKNKKLGTVRAYICTIDGSPIATCGVRNEGETEANAERLVHCWNCHDELVEAAQYAAGILAKIPAFGDSIGDKVTKAQIGIALNRLMVALTQTAYFYTKKSSQFALQRIFIPCPNTYHGGKFALCQATQLV